VELPEVFAAEALLQVEPAGCALIAQVGRTSRAIVAASGLPREGTSELVPLNIDEFCGSVERLACAKDNGCRRGSRGRAQ